MRASRGMGCIDKKKQPGKKPKSINNLDKLAKAPDKSRRLGTPNIRSDFAKRIGK